MSIYEIAITKTAIVDKWEGEVWDIVSEYIDEDSSAVLKKRGYTPKIKKSKEIKRTIYTQVVGDDDEADFNLTRVVAAINGLQMPVKVAK